MKNMKVEANVKMNEKVRTKTNLKMKNMNLKMSVKINKKIRMETKMKMKNRKMKVNVKINEEMRMKKIHEDEVDIDEEYENRRDTGKIRK